MSDQGESEIIRFKPGQTSIALSTGEMQMIKSVDQEKLLERARKIFEQDFLGPEEVSKALNIELATEDIPKIPFSEEDLVRAKELGQRLILRVDKTKSGQPMTMDFLKTHMEEQLAVSRRRKIVNGIKGTIQQEVLCKYDKYWCSREEFYMKDTPRMRWSLASNEILPNSNNYNHLERISFIKDYIENEVFGGMTIPTEYVEAIQEFNDQADEINQQIKSTRNDRELVESSKRLNSLKLTHLTLPTAVEVFYDQWVYLRHTGKHLLRSGYAATSTIEDAREDIEGNLIRVGFFDLEGVRVRRFSVESIYDKIGVCLSR